MVIFVAILHFLELEPYLYYFVITKTLSWSNEKWKLVYINQYSPRKTSQALRDQDINPLKHGIVLIKFKIFLYVETIYTLLGFQVSYFGFSSISPATTGHISVTNTRVYSSPLCWLLRYGQ